MPQQPRPPPPVDIYIFMQQYQLQALTKFIYVASNASGTHLVIYITGILAIMVFLRKLIT